MPTRVWHLNCATLCPPFAGLALPRGSLVAHVLVVETDDGLLLVDTGLGTADLESPRRRLGYPFLLGVGPALDAAEPAIVQLRRMGAQPGDVRHVALTHLDLDHAGGLSDFPDATVHVLAREREVFANPPRRHRARYRPLQVQHGPRFSDYDAGGERWFGFTGVHALRGLADVLLVPLIGHTLGHAGVAVRAGDRWLLHAGDAYFSVDELRGVPGPAMLELFQRVVAMDGERRLANRDRLVELARQGTVDVFCAHDPDELERLRRAAA